MNKTKGKFRLKKGGKRTRKTRRLDKTFRRVKKGGKRSRKMRGGNKCTIDEKLILIDKMKGLKEVADNFHNDFKIYDNNKKDYNEKSYNQFKENQKTHLNEYMKLKEQNPDCLNSNTVNELDHHMLRSFDIETCRDKTKHRSDTGECIEENPYGSIPGFNSPAKNSSPPPLHPRKIKKKNTHNLVEEDLDFGTEPEGWESEEF